MELRDRLTNEDLSKKFRSQFELVSYAIKLAENIILTGRQPRSRTDIQNSAVQILDEISTGKDRMEEQDFDFPEEPVIESVEMLIIEDEDEDEDENLEDEDAPKGHKKKKASPELAAKTPRRTRKILVE